MCSTFISTIKKPANQQPTNRIFLKRHKPTIYLNFTLKIFGTSTSYACPNKNVWPLYVLSMLI